MFEELSDVILSRRTVKVFEGGDVSKDAIQSLLELAIWAPNHRLNEPWRFRVIRLEGIARWIQSFRDLLPKDDVQLFEKNFERLAKVSAVIYVTCLKDSNEIIDFENYAATSAAIQNILLGATALSLQSYWNTGRMMTHPVTTNILKLSENERMVGALWLGHGEITEPRPRTPAANWTQWFE